MSNSKINLDDLMNEDEGDDDDYNRIIVKGLGLPDDIVTPIEDIKESIKEFVCTFNKDKPEGCEVLQILGESIVRLSKTKQEADSLNYIVAYMLKIIGNFHTRGSDEALLHHMYQLQDILYDNDEENN